MMADTKTRAIDELYRDHGPAALRLAFLLVGERTRAEDLVHEGFVRLLGRLRQIREPEALRAYLNQSIVNLAKNDRRHEGVRRRFLASQMDPEKVSTSMPDLGGRDEVHRQLLNLPYRQRAALVLRFCEDLPETEVAQALGTSPKAVRSLVGRGLATLRNERNSDG